MIELGKAYRTRAGKAVRIYAVDGGGDYSVHGAVEMEDGWKEATWTKIGKFSLTELSDGEKDILPADPYGILPRHRELLAEALSQVFAFADKQDICIPKIDGRAFSDLGGGLQAALIALVKLEERLTQDH